MKAMLVQLARDKFNQMCINTDLLSFFEWFI